MSIQAVIDGIKGLTEEELEMFLNSPELQYEFQDSMPLLSGDGIYDWMGKNRSAWIFWAFVYRVIRVRMSRKMKLNTGVEAYVSPTIDQLFEDGVTFLQGPKPMEGVICAYRGGKISVAHAKRDIAPSEVMRSEDFTFIELDGDGRLPYKVERRFSFNDATSELRSLVDSQPEYEQAYQEYFIRFPWVFGLHYQAVQPHKKLDESNIPDYTAVNVRNGLRDIIEIKPPGLKLFKSDGTPSATLHAAFSQCERYLDFADANRDYLLREKGLAFDAPQAILIAGYDVSPSSLQELRRKERMSPRLRIYTYNDIFSVIKSMSETIDVLAQSLPVSSE